MTEAAYNQAVDAGLTNQVSTPDPAATQDQPHTLDLSEYEGLLESLRKPRIFLSAVPTFVPKTFADSIQYVDDGSLKLCVYFENDWNVIPISGGGLSRVRAHLGSTFNFNTQGQITFDTEDYDTNSEWDTGSGTFTAAAEGKYVIHVQLYHSDGVADNQNGIFLYLNGVQGTFSWVICKNTGISMSQVTETLSLTAGDVIRIDAYSNGNSSAHIASGTNNSFITIQQLS